jgi:hypothetical protein
MAKKTPTKIVSKKHLARQERERRQTRLIAGVAIGIVAIIILLITYGLLNDTLFLNWRPAVTVNNESLSMHEFQVRVRATRQSLIAQYMQYIQFAQMFGMDPSTDPQISQTLNQITSELDSSSTIGSQVIDDMTNDLLIRQYAKANGITVAAADVEEAIQHGFNFYPQGTPIPTLTPTQVIYPTLDATQLALVTPTITPTLAPSLTPRPTQTPDLTATVTPVPSITPTATPFTLQAYQTKYQETIKSYASDGMSQALFRKIYYESGLYQDRVKAKVTADVAHTQEQVWARHILVADEATAKSVYDQLVGGADFATLAAKYSIDTSNKDTGGDLGWFGKGKMVPDFETAVFAMKIGAINQPVKTTYGYHIIQVLGHEMRPLTDADYQTAVKTAFDTWLQGQRTNSKIAINNSWTNYVPTHPTLAEAQTKADATTTSYVKTYFAGQTPTVTK